MGTHGMKIATRQARIQKFVHQAALMQQAKKFYILGLTFVLLIGLLSCSKLNRYGMNAIGVNITPIEQLIPPPGRNTGQKSSHSSQEVEEKTVYIQGKVERQVQLVQRQAYQINDSTGKIWAVTNQTGLQKGDEVVIKGKVHHQSIFLAGKDYGEVYLEEN